MRAQLSVNNIWRANHTSFKNLKTGFTQQDTGKQGSKRVDKIEVSSKKKPDSGKTTRLWFGG
ncbi:MAG: hypothetical protein GWN01_10960 [Nitrosopumilaceae archaeon]|nr:hypothetical protein [Nitrosopumilaceae archaeon]NIU01406.1 hypothetical protein [Nitrosopumilaceae archaeon]NIU87764.1 hypothetical protein [Nitrosopumilaceae archaeon]NIV66142.1 hypothetical protein [Nitrosopumilaceae archaeon]NIX62008.1 hypothetical protein [Nitrosopumilaceae archaeon]